MSFVWCYIAVELCGVGIQLSLGVSPSLGDFGFGSKLEIDDGSELEIGIRSQFQIGVGSHLEICVGSQMSFGVRS